MSLLFHPYEDLQRIYDHDSRPLLRNFTFQRHCCRYSTTKAFAAFGEWETVGKSFQQVLGVFFCIPIEHDFLAARLLLIVVESFNISDDDEEYTLPLS